MVITEITYLEKGRVKLSFDCAEDLMIYQGELRKLGIEARTSVSDELYEHIYHGIVGKRAVKRAMHLLEKMDRTEAQLRRKLEEGGYPQALIEEAVEYVKSYRYIDDDRYARNFIRLNQERKSTARMKRDLLYRGVSREIIEHAMDEENETSQEALIIKLLSQKHYEKDTASCRETQKIYQFLLRRGFRSEEIMHALYRYGEDS